MCSHYQTLKDAELLLKKFGAPNKPAGGGHRRGPRPLGRDRRRPHRPGAHHLPAPEGQTSQTHALVLVGQAGGRGLGLGPRVHNSPLRLGTPGILEPRRHMRQRQVVPGIRINAGFSG